MSDNHCGCGHDHDHDIEEQELETMTLTLEDDTEIQCAVLGVFDVEGIEGIELLTIEDDAEFDKVSEAFDSIFDDEDEEEE